ncbi:MAG: HNH endonuclease [Hyphomonadaceae bacterium]
MAARAETSRLNDPKSPSQQRLSPVDRCIYCLATDALTDEHIIPVSLGGLLILPKASCPRCQVVTTRFEQAVARHMYWPLRLRLGIEGSRKRKKPDALANRDCR